MASVRWRDWVVGWVCGRGCVVGVGSEGGVCEGGGGW